MSELNNLLTSIAKLEETKPDKQLKTLYSKKDKDKAEAERSKALQVVDDSSDDSIEAEGETSDFDFEGDWKKGRFSNANPKHRLVNFLEKKSEVYENYEFVEILKHLIIALLYRKK